ncbi:spore coat protein U domain-containing protein [Sphingomonas sp.]|jgi:spore coat protein U-like protein|uniref:spore coat protein U domain-containing protein n=1 Tax=Sphingomonas sp. TaxID=28214 RepID=UPI0035C834E4
MRPTTSPFATSPRRALRRLIALLAGGGMTSHTILTAAIGVPMLMIAKPAQAAVVCSNPTYPYVALYTSGAAAMTNVSLADFGAASCSGETPGVSYFHCTSTGVSSKYGSSYQTAVSAAGGTLTYRLSQNAGTMFTDTRTLWSAGADSAGTQNIWNQNLSIDIPQQNVAAGDYIGSYIIPVDVHEGANCTAPIVTSYNLLFRVTVRINGSCLLGWATSVDFGTIAPDSGGNISQSTQFIQVGATCGIGQSFKLYVSDGNNSIGTGDYRRRMKSGSSYIQYGVFLPAGSSVGSSVPTSGVSFTGTGGSGNSIYNTGSYLDHNTFILNLASGQPISGIEPGVYIDNLVVTMSW